MKARYCMAPWNGAAISASTWSWTTWTTCACNSRCINNYASPYTLKPGEVFTTPALLSLLSFKVKATPAVTCKAGHAIINCWMGKGSRLTLLNNWESTYFDFNERKLKELLKDTKKLGVDLFLLDDGWFANKYPRNNDHAGLGDWQENKKKLPNGIAPWCRKHKPMA
jgi:alpha-galactosidase